MNSLITPVITLATPVNSMTDIKDEDYWNDLSNSFLDKIIGQEFQLLELLGHGAYGCLFLAQSLVNHAYYAVKILIKSKDLQQLQIQQLEIDIQSELKHPSVLGLDKVIQDEDYMYLVMELCDQGDLFDFVLKDQDINPIRQEDQVKVLFLQLLNAVEYMHQQGVYHRDLKLENILLQQNEDDYSIYCKVADFGLATRERYSMEFGCGSTSYLAPEHFDDGSDLVPYDSSASDVWSLGILLLSFMFGRTPWQEASLSDPAYLEFTKNPAMLKEQFFPELSLHTLRWLQAALSPSHLRPSISTLKEQFLTIDSIYNFHNDSSTHLSIPAPFKEAHVSSYDSAFFSGGTTTSWSDMMDTDEDDKSDTIDHPVLDEEDPDMFVHSAEKESWWL